MRSLRRAALNAALPALLLLSACASDANFVAGDGQAPDPVKLQADSADCQHFWPLVGSVFVGALFGAFEGVQIGAVSGDAGEGAIIGAGAGAFFGLIWGAATSIDGAGHERCMAEKGYHPA